MVKAKCQQCGRTVRIHVNRMPTFRYCSRQCLARAKQAIRGENHPLYKRVERKCKQCGEIFYAIPAKVALGEALFCSRRCAGSFRAAHIGKAQTSIERKVGSLLDHLGLISEAQKPLGPWCVDFYLPDKNLVIECDGKYWHSLKKPAVRDRQKNGWLISKGFKVLRLREDSIRSLDPGALYSLINKAAEEYEVVSV